ncbi:MAG: hypothetical protein ACLP52_10080, partial [Streptosporangiaceae bacterium]
MTGRRRGQPGGPAEAEADQPRAREQPEPPAPPEPPALPTAPAIPAGSAAARTGRPDLAGHRAAVSGNLGPAAAAGMAAAHNAATVGRPPWDLAGAAAPAAAPPAAIPPAATAPPAAGRSPAQALAASQPPAFRGETARPPGVPGLDGAAAPVPPGIAPVSLSGRLSALSEMISIGAARAADGGFDPGLLTTAQELLTRAGERLRLSSEHTVVALAGGTGSGKSSLFNALAGADFSTVGV